ncbi:MAG: FadR family transcriptional regulator [Proteobacteria bacterium]|nr:FadR family transcriptional regulator [Pseudomonadota bacterium]MBI3499656.1 FadR family transcriptional regulator [Pseudomonadota bacterium]
MKLERIKRIKTSDAVTERIAALIRDGQLKPGDRLPPETELMRQLDVGRSSIREAIRGLSMLGVVSARPRHGTVVTSPTATMLSEQLASSITHWAIRDLFEVRAVLEGYAAGEAAQRATKQHLEEIAEATAGMERKIAKGKIYFRENQAFHLAIAMAAQNGVLFFCLKSIIGGLRDLRVQMVRRVPEFPERDVSEHRAILAAIVRRDPKHAARLMTNHLRSQIKLLEGRGQTVAEPRVGVLQQGARARVFL